MRYFILLLLSIYVITICGVVVNHIPPLGYELNQSTELRVDVIQGFSQIQEYTLFYREFGSDIYTASSTIEPNKLDSLQIVAYLPIISNADLAYEYYFNIVLLNGVVETLPSFEPENRPYLLQPKIKSGTQSEDLILLSDEDSAPASNGFIVAVSWFTLEEVIDKSQVRLFVKGKDVTAKSFVSNTILLYKDMTPTPGVYTFYVVAKTKDGKELYSQTWTKVILTAGEFTSLPMNLRGTFNTGTNIISTTSDGTPSFGSDRDDGWASLELNSIYKKLRMQSYTYLSTMQSKDAQNANRFRLGVLLPVWETWMGDYSPSFGTYTMSNKNIRGIYSKLNLNGFGLSFAHGEISRAVDSRDIINSATKQRSFIPGSFKQEALAARIQLGKENGFLVGITTTRNRDVKSSLNFKDIFQITETDTLQRVFPKDNLVLSMDSRITIPAQNMVIGIEGAGSLYNNNTYPGPFNKDDLQEYLDSDVPINPVDFQDIFIVNTNMQPMPMSKDFKPKSIFAWKAYLRNFYWNNLINMSYSQVGPSFKALSTGYVQSDATQWMISDQYTYKQILFIGGSISQIKDNLLKLKIETNIYNNYFLNSMIRIPRYPYLMVSYSSNSGSNETNLEFDNLQPDQSASLVPYERKSNVYIFTLGYDFDDIPIAPTSLDISYRNSQENEKREQILTKDNFYTYKFDTSNISFNIINRFIPIPLKTQFSIQTSTQDDIKNDKQNKNFIFSLKGEYWLWNNKIKPWTEYRFIGLGGDQEEQSYNFITLGIEARPLLNTNVSSNLGWHLYDNKETSDLDYKRLMWSLNLSQRF